MNIKIKMIDKQALRKYLDTLIIEHESKISRTVIETLLKIHRKILCNENEAQFRSINPDNPIFLEKVWSLLPARQFMKKCGWFFVENRMFFNDDDALIDIIEILLEYRSVQPKKSEWVEETKIVTKSDEKLRDEQLRRKAAAEREKELAEFRKEKEYKEDLAKKIHADIEADNKRRRELHKNRWSSGCR